MRIKITNTFTSAEFENSPALLPWPKVQADKASLK